MRSFIQMLLALLTLTVMIWVVWQGYLLLRQEQLGLEPGTRAMVIIFAAVGIICTFILSNAISNHGDKIMQGKQFTYRADLYEKCLDAWQSVVDELAAEQQEKVNLDFQELEVQLGLIASAKVIKAFRELQHAAATDGVHAAASVAARQRLLLAMREDMGITTDYFVRKEIQHLSK
ncbi:hypothetical protein [Chitinophaga sp. RAB17]|uniref:hypothetical protein n=1 Tax=Chitinophaga sp. RAB17 TaxID=3233049 RepID=UPI003F8F7789